MNTLKTSVIQKYPDLYERVTKILPEAIIKMKKQTEKDLRKAKRDYKKDTDLLKEKITDKEELDELLQATEAEFKLLIDSLQERKERLYEKYTIQIRQGELFLINKSKEEETQKQKEKVY